MTKIVNSPVDSIHFRLECNCPDIFWESKETGINGSIKKTHIRNMIVNWNNGQLRIKGSISKFINNNNFHNVTNCEIAEAIEFLEITLGVDLKEAVITRIDFAMNIIVKKSVQSYFPYFGECNRLIRNQIGRTSLYYTNDSRVILIYDKIKQMMKDPQTKGIAKIIKDNVLRFEIRYYKSPTIEGLMGRKLRVTDLFDPMFYEKVWQRIYKEYQSIKKIKKQGLNLSQIKKPTDFADLMFATGIKALGGTLEVLQWLKHADFENLSRPEYKGRIVRSITDVNQNPILLCDDNTLRDMEQSFFNVLDELQS